MNYSKYIEQNRLDAFKHFVQVWKKQDSVTVKVDGDIYSYQTKRGKRIYYKKWETEKDAIKQAKGDTIKVQGFVFEKLAN